MQQTHNPAWLDALRITDEQKRSIIEQLAVTTGKDPGTGRRQHRRWTYHVAAGLGLLVKHPGGAVVRFRVHPVDISEHGLGFLHGNFIHQGSSCTAALRTLDGHEHSVNGVIAQCTCVTGKVHLIGVQFNVPIAIENFVVQAPAEEPAVVAAESTATPQSAESALTRPCSTPAAVQAPADGSQNTVAKMTKIYNSLTPEQQSEFQAAIKLQPPKQSAIPSPLPGALRAPASDVP